MNHPTEETTGKREIRMLVVGGRAVIDPGMSPAGGGAR